MPDVTVVTDFTFGTKAETLAQLAPRVTVGRLCDQIVVDLPRWRDAPEAVIAEILDRFAGRVLAVRSSAKNEDGEENSLAGAHHSRIGVAPEDAALRAAIDAVLNSYTVLSDDDEVLVQPLVMDVKVSGVVLTRDLDTGGPYYVINYDDFSGRTDTVTGGAESKCFLVRRNHLEGLRSARFRRLIESVVELEAITGRQALDIEFCIDRDDQVFLLQVRPLAARTRWTAQSDTDVESALNTVRAQLETGMAPHEALAGKTTIFGEMPDWNPVEMLGSTPRPLAVSLYRRLITDRIWADARAAMGYRHIPFPLLTEFAGRPYIDVRLSLNSFLPAAIDAGFAGRLIDHQLAHLAENRDLHDKIEFEIAITCRSPDFAAHAGLLRNAGFPAGEIATFGEALGRITEAALSEGADGLRQRLETTERVTQAAVASQGGGLDEVTALLDATTAYGTLQFSILARHAFIGAAFLRAMVQRGIWSPQDLDRFMRSVRTVAVDLVSDMGAVVNGRMDRSQFLSRYGHLRPGTYDILSARYDEHPDLYLGHAQNVPAEPEPFTMSDAQKRAFAQCLAEEGFDHDPEATIDYIATAIFAREQAKFVFSKGISDTLSLIAAWGEDNGFERDTLSHLRIEHLLAHAGDPARLQDLAAASRETSALHRTIQLPHLIAEWEDTLVVRRLRGRPNFITAKTVTAQAVQLGTAPTDGLEGRVVVIENADPGYDWIFSHNIAGLVTKHGGANSHMAIRCAEFRLPAAIGCGDVLFEKLSRASVIQLNAAARQVTGH